MRELAIVIGLLLLLGSFGIVSVVSWKILTLVSLAMIAFGFATGVPLGVVYHIMLYRALKPLGLLDKHWVWHPVSLNKKVPPERRRGVVGVCYTAAAGFSFIVLGLVLIVVAMVAAYTQLGS